MRITHKTASAISPDRADILPQPAEADKGEAGRGVAIALSIVLPPANKPPNPPRRGTLSQTFQTLTARVEFPAAAG